MSEAAAAPVGDVAAFRTAEYVRHVVGPVADFSPGELPEVAATCGVAIGLGHCRQTPELVDLIGDEIVVLEGWRYLTEVAGASLDPSSDMATVDRVMELQQALLATPVREYWDALSNSAGGSSAGDSSAWDRMLGEAGEVAGALVDAHASDDPVATARALERMVGALAFWDGAGLFEAAVDDLAELVSVEAGPRPGLWVDWRRPVLGAGGTDPADLLAGQVVRTRRFVDAEGQGEGRRESARLLLSTVERLLVTTEDVGARPPARRQRRFRI